MYKLATNQLVAVIMVTIIVVIIVGDGIYTEHHDETHIILLSCPEIMAGIYTRDDDGATLYCLECC